MPERARRTETVRPGSPLRIGDVLLLPIERVVVRAGRAGVGVWVTADVEPHAVVVRDADGVRAVALDGTPVSLGPLRERLPRLDDLLASGDRPAGTPSPGR